MAVKIFLIAVILGVEQICSAQYTQSEQKCGPLELRKANAAFDVFERYIETETDLNDDVNATASEKFESYLKTCDKAPSVLKRLKELKDDVVVRGCILSYFISRATKYDGLKPQLQFVCKLESKMVKQFIENGGARCVSKKKWAMLNYCDRTTQSPTAIIRETECELSEFQTCLVSALGSCSPPASLLLDSMYKEQALMTCNRVPSSGYTELFSHNNYAMSAAPHNNYAMSAAPHNNGLAAISAAVVVAILTAASF